MAIIQRKAISNAIAERDVGVNVGDMSETLSVTQRTIERDLAILQKSGLIRHEGRVNAVVWVILDKAKS